VRPLRAGHWQSIGDGAPVEPQWSRSRVAVEVQRGRFTLCVRKLSPWALLFPVPGEHELGRAAQARALRLAAWPGAHFLIKLSATLSYRCSCWAGVAHQHEARSKTRHRGQCVGRIEHRPLSIVYLGLAGASWRRVRGDCGRLECGRSARASHCVRAHAERRLLCFVLVVPRAHNRSAARRAPQGYFGRSDKEAARSTAA